ncbi:MAG TPA: hypothetical protein DDY78_01785 [Planctomycetales bacterium]|jgi:hypothetical protein|nr:hypothetical protein [Planctomycetales bacterium]
MNKTNTTGRNGRPLTVARLAEAKRLPLDFLAGLGLKDGPRGVGIPYYGVTGEDLFIRERLALEKSAGGDERFRQPKSVAPAAYGQWRLDKAAKVGSLILVEGESDCWTLWFHGLPALGLPGADTGRFLEKEHVATIDTIYISKEPDAGGETFARGVAARLVEHGFKGRAYELRMPEGEKDPSGLHVKGPDEFKDALADCLKAAVPLDLAPAAPEREAVAKKPKPSQADLLVELADSAELFHTPGGLDSEGFATVDVSGRRETWPISGKGFKRWLGKVFYDRTRKAPSSQALQDALTVIAGQAIHDGLEHEVAVRIAEHDGAIYLDLADAQWRAVRVTADGWSVVLNPPVKFIRRRGMLALPEPKRGGRLDELRSLVNLPDDDAWILFVSWLLAAFRPGRPFPVLAVNGEQGSAKSTLCKMGRALIDPNAAPLRRPPREDRDLMVAAANSWIVAFDNLSGLTPALSDTLCALSTGGGFGVRELSSDGDEKLFDAMRPIMLNGIEDLATRADLLDRCVSLTLTMIDDDRRRDEAELWKLFEEARPPDSGRLFGRGERRFEEPAQCPA